MLNENAHDIFVVARLPLYIERVVELTKIPETNVAETKQEIYKTVLNLKNCILNICLQQ